MFLEFYIINLGAICQNYGVLNLRYQVKAILKYSGRFKGVEGRITLAGIESIHSPSGKRRRSAIFHALVEAFSFILYNFLPGGNDTCIDNSTEARLLSYPQSVGIKLRPRKAPG